jgi:hypothetical protein
LPSRRDLTTPGRPQFRGRVHVRWAVGGAVCRVPIHAVQHAIRQDCGKAIERLSGVRQRQICVVLHGHPDVGMAHDGLCNLWSDTHSRKPGSEGRAQAMQVNDLTTCISVRDTGPRKVLLTCAIRDRCLPDLP